MGDGGTMRSPRIGVPFQLMLMLMLMLLAMMAFAASPADAAKRDAACRDWACARREMLAVIDEEFAAVGDSPGTNIRDFTRANGTEDFVNDPGWFRCSQIDFGSFAGLNNTDLQSLIGALSLGELCHQETGTLRDDPTCLAFWASIRAMIRLRDEFDADPLFWRYAAVNWYEGGMGWTNNNAFQLNSYGAAQSVAVWHPDFYMYPSWYSGISNVNVTYSDGVEPTISLESPGDVAAWMLCEMLTTTLTVSNNQVQSGTWYAHRHT